MMGSADEQLPEGTDTIVLGAGVEDEADEVTGGTGERNARDDRPGASSQAGDNSGQPEGAAKSGEGETAGKGENIPFADRIESLRGQAGDRARDMVQAGKDRATAALDNLVQTVEDAASEIDEKLGGQYGDYARRAAQGIGSFSDAVRDKDIDDLFNDARELIKKSPAVAVGAAAAIGFVVARLARAAVPEDSGDVPKA